MERFAAEALFAACSDCWDGVRRPVTAASVACRPMLQRLRTLGPPCCPGCRQSSCMGNCRLACPSRRRAARRRGPSARECQPETCVATSDARRQGAPAQHHSAPANKSQVFCHSLLDSYQKDWLYKAGSHCFMTKQTYSKPCDALQHGVKLKGLLCRRTQSWCSCPT